MTARTYADWKADMGEDVTRLGNELRERWDDWKKDAPYGSWEECLKAELGISADALRQRNRAAKANVSVSKPHTDKAGRVTGADQKSYPAGRPKPSQAELLRRRNHVEDLWSQGHTENQIADALGVSRGSVITDIANLGIRGQGRRPANIIQKEPPDGDFPWSDSDLGIPDEESTIEKPSFAACTTPTANEAIEDVRVRLSLILGGRYNLSLKDRNNLIVILTNALERAQSGTQNSSKDSSSEARIAG